MTILNKISKDQETVWLFDNLKQADGLTIEQAGAKLNIPWSRYYAAKARLNKPNKKPKTPVTTVKPASKSKRPGDIISSAIEEEVNAFINELDGRIDKAINEASQKILKHYKIT